MSCLNWLSLVFSCFFLSLNLRRDEIYCQICKQLVRNNNRKSRMLGWTLLSICLGMFPPTDLFMKVSQQHSHLEINISQFCVIQKKFFESVTRLSQMCIH